MDFRNFCKRSEFLEVAVGWLIQGRQQVETDLGRLEACLQTDTKTETQGRLSGRKPRIFLY